MISVARPTSSRSLLNAWPVARALEVLGLLLAVLLGLLLRLNDLGAKSLAVDEAYTYFVARGSLHLLWANLVADQVPGYFVLLWAVEHLIGGSEWALRLPSGLAGVLAILGTWAVGRELGRPSAGVLAALLGSVYPLGIYWSQEAKPETLWMAIAAWSNAFLIGAWRRRDRRRWIGYWLLSVAGIYTFYLHGLVLLAQNIVVVLALGRRRRWRRLLCWSSAQMVLAIAFAPWLITHLAKALRDVAVWSSLPDGWWVADHLSPGDFLTVNTNALLLGDPNPSLLPTLGTFLSLIAFVWLVGAWVLDSLPALDARGLLIAAWIFVPFVGAYALQLILPAYQSRYLLASAPAILLLIAVGLETLLRRAPLLAAAIAVGLALAWLPTTLELYGAERYEHPGYREAAAYLLAHRQPGELFTGDPDWQAIPFQYYLGARDTFEVLPLAEPAAVLARLEDARRRDASGVWLAVQGGRTVVLDSVLASIGERDGPDLYFHGLALRHYVFSTTPQPGDGGS